MKYFYSYRSHAGFEKSDTLGRGFGQVDDATGLKRATIINPHSDMTAVVAIDYPHHRAKRQFSMRCRKAGFAENLP